MKIEWHIKDEQPVSTDIKPTVVVLSLTAKGTQQEIDWYENQLDKIGSKNKTEQK